MNSPQIKRRLSDRGMFGIELSCGLMRVYPPEGTTSVDKDKVIASLVAAGEDPAGYSIVSSFIEDAVLIIEIYSKV